MNAKIILFTTVLAVAGALAWGDDAADKELVIKACMRCHGLDYDVTPRSRKAWELTIVRMKYMVDEDDPDYTKANIKRMIDYFTKHFHETSTLDPIDHFPEKKYDDDLEPINQDPTPAVVEQDPEPVTTSDSTPAAAVARPARRELSDEIKYRLAHRRWKPSPLLKRAARWGGYAAVLFALALLVTGHLRRTLKLRFRTIHASCALGLFLCLAVHGLVYLIQYGNPMVLWYWLGILSFALLVLAQIQGIIRKKFGKQFVRIHVAAGYISLALAIGHWVVAWF